VPNPPRSGAQWVALLQSLIARELVEQLGLTTRRTAQLLGIAPSAVSQYLHGHRREGMVEEFGGRPEIIAVAHRAAVALAQTPRGTAARSRSVLEAAAKVADLVGTGGPRPRRAAAERVDREVLRQLRERIAAEQAAVTACMKLAQKARDELTRAIFRQIASDSLRHADIVASLEVYLEAGTSRSVASGIDRSDVERLIREEHDAEAHGGAELTIALGGVMKLLAQSMADDEEKHERLLAGLLKEGFAG
jgi:uncharacterized protein